MKRSTLFVLLLLATAAYAVDRVVTMTDGNQGIKGQKGWLGYAAFDGGVWVDGGVTVIQGVTAADGTFDGGLVATNQNGRAGGMVSSYYDGTVLSAHGGTQLATWKLQHPIVAGTNGFVEFKSTANGTVGGTFAFGLWDSTTGSYLCAKFSQSCTSATGTNDCVMDAGNVGDFVYLMMDTTNCSGNNPSGYPGASW